jgi:hypothetical protein
VGKTPGVAPDGGGDGEVEGKDVGKISGVAPDGEVEGEGAGKISGVAPDGEADNEVEGEDVSMASPVGCGVRLSPSPGLSLVDLIRSPRRGGVLLDIWTGAATWTGDL